MPVSDFFYSKATETILIESKEKPQQKVEGANVNALESKITIYDKFLENKDIFTIKISVGDLIIYKNKADIEEKYEVLSVDYQDRSFTVSEFPNQILISVKNIKMEATNSNTISISNIHDSNIQVGDNNSIDINEIKKILKEDQNLSKLVNELPEVVTQKDKNKLQYIIEILLEKGFDVGLSVLIAKITGQI